MFELKANLDKPRKSRPVSRRAGLIGEYSHCGRETLTLRPRRLGAARDLAPKNDHIYYLLGLLESNRGRSAEAIADWRKAIELNPQNLRATYQLAEEIERQGDASSAEEFQKLVEKILAVQPNNLAALLELSRIAAKRGDAATLKSHSGAD